MAYIKIVFKKYFLTGLIAILPLWITLLVVSVLFKWISGFATPFLSPVFYYAFGITKGGFLVRLTSFILAVFVIWCIGLLTTHILGKRFLLWFEMIVLRVPLLNTLYGSVRKLIQYVFTKKRDFKSVVMVEFPRQGIYSVGFVTGTSAFAEMNGEGFVNVFVPTTPNPPTGFLIFARESEVRPLDISVDEAVRLIISGGIIVPHSKERTVRGQGSVPPNDEEGNIAVGS
jgi:uncharacterized membrane protein